MNPNELLENALLKAQTLEYKNDNPALHTILENAAQQKGVFGVVLTSIAYKIYRPEQDIRRHQDKMEHGYSGRTFDTKYITPFLRRHFPSFAMAESAWLTRSLEQPHVYDQHYPGNIRNPALKKAFLDVLESLEQSPKSAIDLLHSALSFLWEQDLANQDLLERPSVLAKISIRHIVEAVKQHIEHPYAKGVTGAARIPVVAMYAMYQLMLPEIKFYSGTRLASLETHTSADSKSHSLGDIDVLLEDMPFEALEIKHNKPITPEMIDVAYLKIKNTKLERYLILTTSTLNFSNEAAVHQSLEQYAARHPCQIITNGVLPTLKYYLRLIQQPERFLSEYRACLEAEFKRSSGIKKEHLEVWHEIIAKLPTG